jgi:hypothetical protein
VVAKGVQQRRNDMDYQKELTAAFEAREAALRAGNADAWHAADNRVRAAVAAMRAEVRLGLRDDPVFCA